MGAGLDLEQRHGNVSSGCLNLRPPPPTVNETRWRGVPGVRPCYDWRDQPFPRGACTPMDYDRHGFPIPPTFEPPPHDAVDFGAAAPGRDRSKGFSDRPPASPVGRRAGRGKRIALVLLALGVLVPAVVVPVLLPAIREIAVEASVEEALRLDALGDVKGALVHLDRAVSFAVDDPRLFCLRGQVRLSDGDAPGAFADVDAAVRLSPTDPEPLRLRATVSTVLDRADEALADAEAVVDLVGPGNAEALNLRAYTRALVRRDLPEALVDIEQALSGAGVEMPEHLDTRGYILHLLGRHSEAIDDLNRAIDGMQELRRQMSLRVGRGDATVVSQRLRLVDQGLAVMHQHRAEACRAAGFAAQAEQDFEIARRKGYDPTKGVF